MGGCKPSLDDIIELGIGADAFVSDQQSCRYIRIELNQVSHEGQDGIRGLSHTEQNLVVRIVKTERRRQRLFTEILQAADWANDRNAFGPSRFGRFYVGAADAVNDGRNARHV